jgi:predicted transcriptional regulator
MNEQRKLKKEKEGFEVLCRELMGVMGEIEDLERVAEEYWGEVQEWERKYTEEILDLLPPEELREAMARADHIMDGLGMGVKELKALTKKYNDVVDRINERYGEEVLKKEDEYVHPYLEDLEVDLGEKGFE